MTQAQMTERTTWDLDPAHSQVEFTARHMMITKVRGRFATVNGTVEVDESDLSRSGVEVEIEAPSIDTREEDRDAHLRSEDFLDVENHPTLRFRSTRVEGLELEPDSEFRVVGDLTIRGTTREVTLDAVYEGQGTDPWGGERMGFSADTVIDRRKFGLEWNQALETGGILVGNDIEIHLEAQAVRRDGEE